MLIIFYCIEFEVCDKVGIFVIFVLDVFELKLNIVFCGYFVNGVGFCFSFIYVDMVFIVVLYILGDVGFNMFLDVWDM